MSSRTAILSTMMILMSAALVLFAVFFGTVERQRSMATERQAVAADYARSARARVVSRGPRQARVQRQTHAIIQEELPSVPLRVGPDMELEVSDAEREGLRVLAMEIEASLLQIRDSFDRDVEGIAIEPETGKHAPTFPQLRCLLRELDRRRVPHYVGAPSRFSDDEGIQPAVFKVNRSFDRLSYAVTFPFGDRDDVQCLVAGPKRDETFVTRRVGGDPLVVRFATRWQLDERSSRDDAREELGDRLRDAVFEIAHRRYGMEPTDKYDFMIELDRRFPKGLLVEQGTYRLQTTPLRLGPDQVVYLSDVEWTSTRSPLRDIARAVVSAVRTKHQAPWIRCGLTIGALLVAFLGWLRVDWWLKGHYSFMTKMACAMLLVAALGLIWSVRLG